MSLQPALDFVSQYQKQRIIASDFDGLSDTMKRAWDNPHRWQRCMNYEDGIKRVICIPKVSKNLTRYWLWGYDLTVGKIHWQNTRYPYVQ